MKEHDIDDHGLTPVDPALDQSHDAARCPECARYPECARCPECEGVGALASGEPCPVCDGTGKATARTGGG